MKSAASAPGKRRRGPRVAVLVLVFCSLLVPLAFLFDRFPAGYVIDEGLQEFSFQTFDRRENKGGVEEQELNGKEDLGRLIPALRKGDAEEISHSTVKIGGQNSSATTAVLIMPKKALLPPETKPTKPVPALRKKNGAIRRKGRRPRGTDGDEAVKACQLEFGSYCLWSIEHKEIMKDLVVKRLKDQLFVARAYYPSIAKIRGKEALARDLKQNIQDHEKILSESIVDADLPSYIGDKIEMMDQVNSRAKSCPVDCGNVDRKLRQILDMTEDEAHFHMKQSAFLYNLGVQTMPKSHHCLSMRLTVEYFKSNSLAPERSYAYKFSIPSYRHYVIFSKNVVAASVVVNSTYSNSKVTGNIVFHVLTDAENYYAMQHWFARNSPTHAALHVINYEDFITKNFPYFDLPQMFLPEEFRISVRNIKHLTEQTRMEYVSVFSHSHFFLPEIFKDLKRIVVLDDDVVVQGDLSHMWNLDMGDMVNGAVRFCQLRLAQLQPYMGQSTYDPQSCAWMSGINIIDLDKWKEHRISEKYMQLLQQFKTDKVDARSAAFPLSLLAFDNLIYPLNEGLVLSGLGYDYNIEEAAASGALLLHYNGNMKPWLELGIPEYKRFWKRFLTRDDRFMDECNVHL